MLYTLNLYGDVYQLYFNKTEKNKCHDIEKIQWLGSYSNTSCVF